MSVLYLAVEPVPLTMVWPGYILFAWIVFAAYHKISVIEWTDDSCTLVYCSVSLASTLHATFMGLISVNVAMCDLGDECTRLSYIFVYMVSTSTVNWIIMVMANLVDLYQPSGPRHLALGSLPSQV